MPAPAIPRTIGDFIFYYYAKLVVASAAGQAKNYRFIMDQYKRFKSGQAQISAFDREIGLLAQRSDVCAFCGEDGDTVPTTIVPASLGGPIGIHNMVYACVGCQVSKGDKDLLKWWCDELGNDKDDLPRIPAGLFLKLAYERHTLKFSLKRPCHDIRNLWGPSLS